MRLFILPDWFLNLFPYQNPKDVASSFLLAFCNREIENLKSLTTKNGMKNIKNSEIQVGDLEGFGTPVFCSSNENTAHVFYECIDHQERDVKIKVSLERVLMGFFGGKKDKWLVSSVAYYNSLEDYNKTYQLN
ncbi:MAG TPA: hypothetical protein VGB63_16845 [Pedobacter sp.]|jgi:hypothetical protein